MHRESRRRASERALEIAGLPPGKYRVSAWHERFGELEKEVELSAGEKRAIQFEYQD